MIELTMVSLGMRLNATTSLPPASFRIGSQCKQFNYLLHSYDSLVADPAVK